MMQPLTESKYGVRLYSLNWGYQIIHGGYVVGSVADPQAGPHRSDACADAARREYERICGLYERLYSWSRPPTKRQVAAFACVLRGSPTRHIHMSTLKSLERRGLIACDDYALDKWRIAA